MPDFGNIRGKPREVAIVIAARSALRAVPTLATALARDGVREAGRNIVLPTFRGMAAPWATAEYPAHNAASAPPPPPPQLPPTTPPLPAPPPTPTPTPPPAPAPPPPPPPPPPPATAPTPPPTPTLPPPPTPPTPTKEPPTPPMKTPTTPEPSTPPPPVMSTKSMRGCRPAATQALLRQRSPSVHYGRTEGPNGQAKTGNSSARPCVPPAKTGRYGLNGIRHGCAAALRTKRSKSPA